MPSWFVDVDPRGLRVTSSRPQGADPAKLQRQIFQFGASQVGMPPPVAYEGMDGELVLFNGVTRATRMAKLAPGTRIRVEIMKAVSKRGQAPRRLGARPRFETASRQASPEIRQIADDWRPVAMIAANRQEIIRRLERLSELAPDMRFGQLIANLAVIAAGPWNETLWNLEDDQLLVGIRQLETDLESRQAAVA